MSWLSGLFGNGSRSAGEISTALDLVIYAAGLASSSEAIDPTLDKVRMITAQVQPGGSVPAAVELPLLHAYLEIELYLINHEPIRAFSKEMLRKRLSKELLVKLSESEGAKT